MLLVRKRLHQSEKRVQLLNCYKVDFNTTENTSYMVFFVSLLIEMWSAECRLFSTTFNETHIASHRFPDRCTIGSDSVE